MQSSLQTLSTLLPDRLARQGATLTASERALADALGRDYPHALLESATALAGRTGTSASTVVRLFAKLGYASYAEAQREARGEVTALLQTAGQRAPVTIGTERSLQQCVDDALLHDQHNIAATRDGLDMAAFEAIVARIAQSQGRIFVLAQINSAPVAAWLALHLVYLLGNRNRVATLINLSWRYIAWGHGGGVIVGDEPTEPLHHSTLTSDQKS